MLQLIRIFSLALLLVASCLAQGFKIVDGSGNERIVGAAGAAFDSGHTAITTGGVDLATSTTKLQLLFCSNITSTERTVDIADKSGTPKVYFNDVPIAGNTVMLMVNTLVGLPMSGGLTVTASANSAIVCQAVGVQ